MTEPLYTLPNGNAVTLEDVRNVRVYDAGITVKHADDTITISPSNDPERDRDALIEAVNAAWERDRRFIVLTERATGNKCLVSISYITFVSPPYKDLPITLVINGDPFQPVETFAEVAAMLGVKL